MLSFFNLTFIIQGHNKNSNVSKRKQMDPVALHHYYKKEWQTHKAPGDKNHDQLRWKIKQMMIRK